MNIYADKVLASNNIFTVDNFESFSGGVAVKGNKILAVGTMEEIDKYIGNHTVVYNFGNKLIIPGFCDSHAHLKMSSVDTHAPHLYNFKSKDECGQYLKEYYEAHKGFYSDNEWLIGFGWYHTYWDEKKVPTAADLDKYLPDIPVFLFNGDCHAAWVNSKGLEIAGITKDTPDVEFGEVYRYEDGTPTGYLEEEAMKFCTVPAFTISECKEKMLMHNTNRYLREFGVTSFNDMMPFFGYNVGNIDMMKEMAAKNELDFRINIANELFDDFEYTLALRDEFSDKEGFVYHNGLKEFMDGIVTTHTAVMLDKYTDASECDIDYRLSDFDKLEQKIIEAQKLGLNIHLHAVGDGAIRKALDMYEKAIKTNGKNNARLSIEHIDLSDPADWHRFGELGVIASMQPPHVTLTPTLESNDYPPVVGSEREKNLWAIKSLQDNGAVLAFGTDYPVVEADPFITLHRAVTRRFSDGKPYDGWNPQEKITIEEAIAAYTLGGAKMVGKEDVLGTLTAGKLADIIVIDKNLLAIDPQEILDAKVVFTMVNGKVVFQR